MDGHGPHLARVRYKYPLSLLAAASHHCVISRFPSPASLLFRSPPPPPPMEGATAAHPASSSVSAAHWMATEDLGLRRNIINNMCVTTRSPPSPVAELQGGPCGPWTTLRSAQVKPIYVIALKNLRTRLALSSRLPPPSPVYSYSFRLSSFL